MARATFFLMSVESRGHEGPADVNNFLGIGFITTKRDKSTKYSLTEITVGMIKMLNSSRY